MGGGRWRGTIAHSGKAHHPAPTGVLADKEGCAEGPADRFGKRPDDLRLGQREDVEEIGATLSTGDWPNIQSQTPGARIGVQLVPDRASSGLVRSTQYERDTAAF
jgi:hypothetical protein